MALNDSSTGGFVRSYAPPVPPSCDDAFDAIMQNMVSGITGIPGNLVRPRWQPILPQIPEPTVDWCAIGVVYENPEYSSVVRHWQGEPTNPGDRNGQGFDEYNGIVFVEILSSFYGPNASANANAFRDGLSIGQNREALYLANMQLVSYDGRMVKLPELVNETLWYRRVDFRFLITREIVRSYPILNVLEADGTIIADPEPTVPFKAGPTAPNKPSYPGP
jgi:hypothetical protein